jgi:hypothetical protein
LVALDAEWVRRILQTKIDTLSLALDPSRPSLSTLSLSLSLSPIEELCSPNDHLSVARASPRYLKKLRIIAAMEILGDLHSSHSTPLINRIFYHVDQTGRRCRQWRSLSLSLSLSLSRDQAPSIVVFYSSSAAPSIYRQLLNLRDLILCCNSS